MYIKKYTKCNKTLGKNKKKNWTKPPKQTGKKSLQNFQWQQPRQNFGYSEEKEPEFKNLTPFGTSQSQPASRDSCVRKMGIEQHWPSQGTVISRALVKNWSDELFSYSITFYQVAFRDSWHLSAPSTAISLQSGLQRLYFALLLLTKIFLLAQYLRWLAPLHSTPRS